MKTPKARSGKRPPAKPSRPPALTGYVVLDALRSWVVPTVTISLASVMYLAHNLGIVEPQFAVTAVGICGLALVLFASARAYLDSGPRLVIATAVFAILWGAAIVVPFYRTLNPGTPVFSTALQRSGPPITVPVGGKPGRYKMLVESHFAAGERGHNRTATYHIGVAHDGTPEQVVEGTFHQDWFTQRIGAGRRSFSVPGMSETTQVFNVVDDPDGGDLRLRLTDLSPGVGDAVTVRLYAEPFPNVVLIVLGAVTIVAATLLDAYRPTTSSPGLLASVTVGGLIAVVSTRASTSATLGFPQLAIAAILGLAAGFVGGKVLSLVSRQLKSSMPALD